MLLVYPSAVQVSTRQLQFVSDLLRARRARIRTGRPRALSVSEQVAMALARLRNDDTYTRLAAGFKVSLDTAHRAVREVVALLAERAPTLQDALARAKRKAYTVLDGTIIATDRVRAKPKGRDKAFFSGKTHAHGLNVQVLADPRGELLWASDPLPGATVDITAARTFELPERLADLVRAGVPVLADKGYIGAGEAISTPYRPYWRKTRHDPEGRLMPLSDGQKAVNSSHAKRRAPGERANAQLKTWRNLRHLRDDPTHATNLLRAITTLITHS